MYLKLFEGNFCTGNFSIVVVWISFYSQVIFRNNFGKKYLAKSQSLQLSASFWFKYFLFKLSNIIWLSGCWYLCNNREAGDINYFELAWFKFDGKPVFKKEWAFKIFKFCK